MSILGCREARTLRDEARALVATDTNPRACRKQKRRAAKLAEENSFGQVFKRWHAHRSLFLKKGRQSALSLAERIFANGTLVADGGESLAGGTNAGHSARDAVPA